MKVINIPIVKETQCARNRGELNFHSPLLTLTYILSSLLIQDEYVSKYTKSGGAELERSQ